ncbi:hypothetical protein IV203_021144 [Nitzschia inconspicua]|uniref:Vps41 beta-propeller domain-containing protein n=1 Tax=Nitzschia inconspicua TaxID=303405 RepID=A0A9K3PFP9_9STRA|nr:hypothetical protein IV203_021144 [Nitzschia inconspicua]
MTKDDGSPRTSITSSPSQKTTDNASTTTCNVQDVTTSLALPHREGENVFTSTEDRTVSTEDFDNDGYDNEDDDVDEDDDDDDDGTNQEMPLLNYSRLFSASLPRKMESEKKNDETTNHSYSYFKPSCTCSELTVIRVDPEDLTPSGGSATNNTFATSATTTTTTSTSSASSSPILPQHTTTTSTTTSQASNSLRQQQQLLTSDLWQQPHLIMACGWEANNTITLTNVRTDGTSLPVVFVGTTSTSADSGSSATTGSSAATIKLAVRETESTHSVVDMSFDASGTVLGAIDEGGTCAIWEMKYTATLQPNSLLFLSQSHHQSTSRPTTTTTRPTSETTVGNNNMFSNWMSALTGMPPLSSQNQEADAATVRESSQSTSTSSEPVTSSVDGMRATLTAQLVSQPSRINYPSSWGPPTCMVLEPSFKRKREKSLLVGFANGRLVLTKRGNFFQRRNDTVLYQAGNTAVDAQQSQYRGIETVAWRASLVAWADSNGIKLLDMEHLTRIAHIDRPTGARPSLYPTVRDLQPTLFFETSNHLLVAWGDCLMQMQVDEHVEPVGIGSSGSGEGNMIPPAEVKKRRTVQCTMAWELDCVACDAVPLDANHIAVLGLVPMPEAEKESDNTQPSDTVANSRNDVELQILSRIDGSISHCDSLPLLRSASHSPPDSALHFRLLSSFALPRMDDSEETKVLQSRLGNGNDLGFVGIDVEFDLNQNLFSGTNVAARRRIEYRDPHLQWKLDNIVYNTKGNVSVTSNDDPIGNNDDDEDEETKSVDSDDYECVLRPIETFEVWQGLDLEQKAPAPTMIVCSASDAVLSLVSTIDDAVANALFRRKCAMALKLAVRHRRRIRHYKLDDLANRYIEAILRIRRPETSELEMIPASLSLRRMQLAVKAMPILFGNKITLWEKWMKELENLPGALFLARKYLPVRDPILPASIYGRALEQMLIDSEKLTQMMREDIPLQPNVDIDGTKHFLESLIAWGPTKVLKEYIKLYKYSRDLRKGDKTINEDLKGAETALQRRYMQTASVYMQFPVRDDVHSYEGASHRFDAEKDESQDSLFEISKLLSIISPRTPLVMTIDEADCAADTALPHMILPNNHTSLEAMARLRMMQGQYDLALKCFLAIGACHCTESLESFESRAIDIVNGSLLNEFEPPVRIGTFCYDYILVLIESQHLNQCLLQDDFVLSTDSKLYKPLFALLRLVGLQRLGNFLIEHCVSPDFSYNMTLSEASPGVKSTDNPLHHVQRREPLPLDQVAKQLESSPALLHWYLHLVFTRRPELYIKFPNNAVPPKAVTALHRQHFQLYVDFAGKHRDSTRALASTQQYNAESTSTPMLSFLKASLTLGGLLPTDARRVLEIERSKRRESEEEDDELEPPEVLESSPLFALELAYIIENYSDQTEKVSLSILNLYLLGCKSLMLSVSFAQRQKQYSSLLWDRLISYCTEKTSDGILFGELLESAAYSGADLARLVERIPPGMVVEGLRPRLVAAVADYRMKLEIYTAATAAGSEEAIVLMREIAQRSRRGVRYSFGKHQVKSYAELISERNSEDKGVIGEKITEEIPTALSRDLTIRSRPTHSRLAYTISTR